MSRLADLPELVGFFGYSVQDDTDSMSALRRRIQLELRGQLGRSSRDFRIWQDEGGIPTGRLWEDQIRQAIAQSIFFIPIITPSAIKSHQFAFELDECLARERQLCRQDLIFPILYVLVPELEQEQDLRKSPVLQIVAARQYFDWRSLRYRDVNSTEVRSIIERFCRRISEALFAPTVLPNEDAQHEINLSEPNRGLKSENSVDEVVGIANVSKKAAKVFISYRREDTKYQAREIYRALCNVLPRENVFMDIDTIPLGKDFVEVLEGWVDQCEVLLALIGPTWIAATDPASNQRRLENMNDFVRVEIREGLRRGIPVVPVLLDRAPMPDPGQLPEDIRKLVRRQAEFLEFRTFETDVTRLIKRLRLTQ